MNSIPLSSLHPFPKRRSFMSFHLSHSYSNMHMIYDHKHTKILFSQRVYSLYVSWPSLHICIYWFLLIFNTPSHSWNTGSMSHHPSNPLGGPKRESERHKKTGSLSWYWVWQQRWDKPQKNQQRMQRTRPGVKRGNSTDPEEPERETSIKVLKSYTLMVEVRTDNRGSSTR